MMPPGGGGAMMPMAAAGNYASPGLRLVGGLIDIIIIGVVGGIIYAITKGNQGVSSLIDLVLTLAYFGYFLSSRGQSVGMMVFGFHVRDVQTGQFPSMGKSVLRGFVWWLELGFTICIVGLIGWLWMFWDPQKQGWHDKAAGTIVTTG
jgi:uncharacterized RDD family membrane protein YckC